LNASGPQAQPEPCQAASLPDVPFQKHNIAVPQKFTAQNLFKQHFSALNTARLKDLSLHCNSAYNSLFII
jgi:hypothetical protein